MLAFNKLSIALSLALLGGCAQDLHQKISNDQMETQARGEVAQTLIRKKQVASPYLVEESLPRFTTRSVPYERIDKLPVHLGKVTMRVPGRHSLSSVGEMVQRLIEIPVVLTPDALLDVALFAPGQAAGAATLGANTGSNAGVSKAMQDNNDIKQRAVDAGANQATFTDRELSSTFELNYSGTATGLLDYIAIRAGVQWQYQQGRITFSRVVTRSMSVKALAGGLKTAGAVSMGGGMTATASAESDVWPMLEATLKNLISPRGRIQVDPKNGTVTVTDALQNVNAVSKFLDKQNDTMLRQIVLDVEVLQVDLKQEHASGIDWSVVSRGLGGALSLNAPGSVGVFSGSTGGSVGAAMSRNDGGSVKALVNALEQYGRVTSTYSTVVATTNRQPVPLGVQSSESYLAQVTAGTSNAATGVATGATLTPGTVSTGFSMVLMPVIMDSNRVLIESTLQVSALRELKDFSSGAGATLNRIQLPSVDSYSTMQRINVASGDTMVMSGFERETNLRDENDMVRGVVPGSRRGKTSKQSTVILITPRLQ
ncbi:hypothetical protein C5F52_08300 [Limnohabitans sp. TS-CS-82]|uniref:hypothetical protein n=1 Tax=Limnohabitans sp. TS-CS-82 TaxID=2094193 RepID=UPI000CF1E865|nr:hypothetical protein [Limnohabitans sp. TS-CS-82]PQA83441.1 hypothetical protein C5F52_08300 [Limnohabitans sp. TS-CS-82]